MSQAIPKTQMAVVVHGKGLLIDVQNISKRLRIV